MEKLHVKVGYVFTQVMFCDGHGKLHLHRVMTDVDKPWRSVKEVLGLVKNALGVLLLMAVQVEIQYRQVHFSSLLASLREELTKYLDNRCQLTIQVFEETVEEPVSKEEVVEEELVEEEVYEQDVYEEEVQMVDAKVLVAEEAGQAIPAMDGRLFPIYREADASLTIMENKVDRIEVWNRKASQPVHFFVDENRAEAVTEIDQRGSPVDLYG